MEVMRVARHSKLEIDTMRLQSDIERLRAEHLKLKKNGDNMMNDINALNSMWEGEAKDAFVAQFESDYNTLQSMAEVIEKLILDLEHSKKVYEKCENSVGSIVNSIRV